LEVIRDILARYLSLLRQISLISRYEGDCDSLLSRYEIGLINVVAMTSQFLEGF
jgi:hypothetical protein